MYCFGYTTQGHLPFWKNAPNLLMNRNRKTAQKDTAAVFGPVSPKTAPDKTPYGFPSITCTSVHNAHHKALAVVHRDTGKNHSAYIIAHSPKKVYTNFPFHCFRWFFSGPGVDFGTFLLEFMVCFVYNHRIVKLCLSMTGIIWGRMELILLNKKLSRLFSPGLTVYFVVMVLFCGTAWCFWSPVLAGLETAVTLGIFVYYRIRAARRKKVSPNISKMLISRWTPYPTRK